MMHTSTWLVHKAFCGVLPLLLATGVLPATLQASTTINPVHREAYGAHIGWLNARGNVAGGDGIPDAYEYKVAGDLTTLGPAPDDWDGDGSTDLDEYLADTDPFEDESFFAITHLVRAAPTNFVTWTVQPTRHYLLEQNTEITNTTAWVDSGYGVLLPGPGPDLTRGVAATNESVEFYQARALLPLSL